MTKVKVETPIKNFPKAKDAPIKNRPKIKIPGRCPGFLFGGGGLRLALQQEGLLFGGEVDVERVTLGLHSGFGGG